ncbi:MAG: hypothetical protein VYA34_02510 [Myxococcota bacterium]|nr:hypothetical protein [Myxococcota bacterium]
MLSLSTCFIEGIFRYGPDFTVEPTRESHAAICRFVRTGPQEMQPMAADGAVAVNNAIVLVEMFSMTTGRETRINSELVGLEMNPNMLPTERAQDGISYNDTPI